MPAKTGLQRIYTIRTRELADSHLTTQGGLVNFTQRVRRHLARVSRMTYRQAFVDTEDAFIPDHRNERGDERWSECLAGLLDV